MCGRTRTRVVREGAHDRAFIGEGGGKVGRNEKESGGKEVKGGVIVGRKDCRWKNEGEEDGRERETRIGKVFSLCEKRSVAIIKGEISRRSARSMGKYRTEQGKIEVRG